MWLLGILVCGFLFFTGVILPWSNRSRVREQEIRLKALQTQLKQLLSFLESTGVAIPAEIAAPPPQWPWQVEEARANAAAAARQEMPEDGAAGDAPPAAASASEAAGDATAEMPPARTVSFEQQFGARLPVWIGGVALALAGFFLVKYSIETGLLSPAVRVVLGGLFGLGLLYAANWVRARPHIDNGVRIAQALSGAGIADLYLCLFAATSLYGLVPTLVGFGGMAVVTAAAVLLSLRHGMPIALLGLVGGFMTPALLGGDDAPGPFLFLYFYLLLAGLLSVSRGKGWWWLAIPSVAGAFIWACIWLFGGEFMPGDSIYLGLFLIAVSATVIATSHGQQAAEYPAGADASRTVSALNYIAFGGALLLMAALAHQVGFGALEWGLYGLLSLGGVALAFGDQERYGRVPWISMAVNAAMLLAWDTGDAAFRAFVIAAFGGLYIASGYLLQSRSERPLLWAGLVSAASLGYYLLGYYGLRHSALVADIPLFWGGLALAMALVGTLTLRDILTGVADDHPQKPHLVALYTATGTAFVALELTIELPREFLSVAFALLKESFNPLVMRDFNQGEK